MNNQQGTKGYALLQAPPTNVINMQESINRPFSYAAEKYFNQLAISNTSAEGIDALDNEHGRSYGPRVLKQNPKSKERQPLALDMSEMDVMERGAKTENSDVEEGVYLAPKEPPSFVCEKCIIRVLSINVESNFLHFGTLCLLCTAYLFIFTNY